MSEARTAGDLRDDFMDACRTVADYWADPAVVVAYSCRKRIEGALHSWLCLIDGASSAFPCSLDLVARPHPDDRAFDQAEGEDWVADGTVINESDMLHELLYNRGSWRGRHPGAPGTEGAPR